MALSVTCIFKNFRLGKREEGRGREGGEGRESTGPLGSLRVARARAVSHSMRDGWQAVRDLKVHQERGTSRYRGLDALCIKARRCQERADIKSASIESLSPGKSTSIVKRF